MAWCLHSHRADLTMVEAGACRVVQDIVSVLQVSNTLCWSRASWGHGGANLRNQMKAAVIREAAPHILSSPMQGSRILAGPQMPCKIMVARHHKARLSMKLQPFPRRHPSPVINLKALCPPDCRSGWFAARLKRQSQCDRALKAAA